MHGFKQRRLQTSMRIIGHASILNKISFRGFIQKNEKSKRGECNVPSVVFQQQH